MSKPFGPAHSWLADSGGGSSAPVTLPYPAAVEKSPNAGEVVMITGGGTGLGRAIALDFARNGYRVAFCWYEMDGRDVQSGAMLTEAALASMGVEVLAVRCDVRDRAQVNSFVDRIIRQFGAIHVLVNNAGIAHDGALWRLSGEAWRAVLDTNVTGAFHCLAAVAPYLRKQRLGRVVNVSAHQAVRPGFGVANYAASKAALEGLTRAAAVELGPSNVNVNAVAPGFVRSERLDTLPHDVIERARKRSVLGRLAEPEDVSRVIVFLCSEAARHITGQTLVVDGGMSLE